MGCLFTGECNEPALPEPSAELAREECSAKTNVGVLEAFQELVREVSTRIRSISVRG